MPKKTVSIVNHDKLVELVKSHNRRASDIKSRLAPILSEPIKKQSYERGLLSHTKSQA